ncbi:MAG TPA: DUF1015 family protein [Amycolatopsis sp.]|nr:DUF1015 family protein [Amycolatopsis sp.]
MTQWITAIGQGWLVDGAVPGPDVDEFADAGDVIAALARHRGDSLLAVQHPHRTPRARADGLSVTDVLPAARRELDRLLATSYRPVTDVVAPYLVDGPDGAALGVLCLVDPNEISRVRHSEQVYPAVVAERATMLAGLGHATSAAMLIPVTDGARLTDAVSRAVRTPPAVRTVDPAGRIHRLWLVGPGPDQDRLLSVLRAGPLMVADGNHRVAASARAGSNLLALVTAGPDLRVGAFHRELTGTGLSAADLEAAWRRAGLRVRHDSAPHPPDPHDRENPDDHQRNPSSRPPDPSDHHQNPSSRRRDANGDQQNPSSRPPDPSDHRQSRHDHRQDPHGRRQSPSSHPPDSNGHRQDPSGQAPRSPGVVRVLAGRTRLVIDLPAPEPGEPLPRIDHAIVERLLIAAALGIDPEGPHVRPVPAGHPPGPDVDAVLEVAPVPMSDVIAVHAQNRLMPRKSTYVTPKPRTGLLIAALTP